MTIASKPVDNKATSSASHGETSVRHAQDTGDICAQTEKRGMAERDLARVPHQQIESHHNNRIQADDVDHIQVVRIGNE